MSYQLVERPHKFVFSGNPVRYIFNVSNPNTPGCAMEVALYVVDIGQDPFVGGTLVTKQSLTPNPDGKVNFYCEDYLNSQLDWQMPELSNDDVIAVTKQIKHFYVEYRQITKANQSPQWQSDIAHHRIVLKGGVAKEKFDRNNFFINYLPTKTPFLTWLPDKHFVGLEERRYLTYFHFYDDPDILLIPQLKARVVYTDGTEEITTKPFPALNETKLFHCPAGLKQLGLDNLHPDKQIWYYDVNVVDGGSGVDLITPYRLYADYRKFYNVFSFVYHNSISGMDTLRIRGDWDIELSLNSTDIQQATGGDFSGEILPTENASINISSYKTFDGDAGWMNTKKMQEALEDMLLSDGVYRELFGKRWLRVMNLSKSQKMGANNDTKWSFPLKWRYTFDNNFFTPFDTDFGAGVMDEAPGELFGICTAPFNLQKELIDDQPAQQTYRLSWNAVPDAMEYELEWTGPDGIPHTLPLVDTHYDLTATAEGDYNWRVRTKCGENDYSGFNVGPGFNVHFIVFACNAPANISTILISINGNLADIKFSWAAVVGVYGYQFEWREVGVNVWNSQFVAAGITQLELNLTKDTQYEYRIRSQCNNNAPPDYSGYLYGAAFVPSNLAAGVCTLPGGLNAQTTILSGFYWARFDWTMDASVANYDLQYRKVGAANWNNLPGVSSPKVLAIGSTGGFNGITTGDQVEWRVRGNCVAGGSTIFVNGPNFIV